MKLKFIIVCENAFVDETKRLNVIQAFDIIKATSFPAFHPQMSIVTKWEFEDGDSKQSEHKQKLTIIEDQTDKIIIEIPEKELTSTAVENKSLQFITNIIGLKFDNAGIYRIQVYMDKIKADDEETFEVNMVRNQ